MSRSIVMKSDLLYANKILHGSVDTNIFKRVCESLLRCTQQKGSFSRW